jgi:2-dehydropantoate 2-reductase
LIEGKPSELESQTGVIVRYGKQSKIPTPINSFIYNTLLPSEKIVRGELDLPDV